MLNTQSGKPKVSDIGQIKKALGKSENRPDRPGNGPSRCRKAGFLPRARKGFRAGGPMVKFRVPFSRGPRGSFPHLGPQGFLGKEPQGGVLPPLCFPWEEPRVLNGAPFLGNPSPGAPEFLWTRGLQKEPGGEPGASLGAPPVCPFPPGEGGKNPFSRGAFKSFLRLSGCFAAHGDLLGPGQGPPLGGIPGVRGAPPFWGPRPWALSPLVEFPLGGFLTPGAQGGVFPSYPFFWGNTRGKFSREPPGVFKKFPPPRGGATFFWHKKRGGVVFLFRAGEIDFSSHPPGVG